MTAPAIIDPSLVGKLVYVSAPVSTATGLVDATFGVSTPGLSLVRKVEMYQWKEKVQSTSHDNLGGSQTTQKTYSYEQVWSDKEIDYAQFHVKDSTRVNPTNWMYRGASFTQPSANLGAYTVGTNVISQMPAYYPFTPSSLTLPPVVINPIAPSTTDTPATIDPEATPAGIVDQAVPETVAVVNTASPSSTGATLRTTGNGFYYGGNPETPKIGDLRITYLLANPTSLSVVGAQEINGILGEYTTQNDTRILLVESGIVGVQEMFATAISNNTLLTWAIRAGGLILMFIGFNAFFAIIPMLAAFVPFLSTVIGFGVGFIALILTLTLGGGTIALAWFAVRPLISAIIIGVVVIAGVLIYRYKSQKNLSAPIVGVGV